MESFKSMQENEQGVERFNEHMLQTDLDVIFLTDYKHSYLDMYSISVIRYKIHHYQEISKIYQMFLIPHYA